MDAPITKRIHVSGLTPAITAGDLEKRLSSFGTVKAVDGIGLLDGVGQPRKFGYVTIETTVGKLARCMNLLSGSTWKGAKLRFGEARPDFAERLAEERASAESAEPPRKRRRCNGVLAQDMSLVTPEIAEKRGGWKVTPLGRILRPIRMRPERPLPPTLEEEKQMAPQKKSSSSRTDKTKEKKKKVNDPDSRARRRTIDMTKWGSTQLKGIFLESQGATTRKQNLPELVMDEEVEDSSDSDSEEEPGVQQVHAEEGYPLEPAKSPSPPKKLSPPATSIANQPEPVSTARSSNIDIAFEKKKTLDLLASLFDEDDDWVGKESVGSDIDEAELLKRDDRIAPGFEDDFEVVPQQKLPIQPPSMTNIEAEVPTHSDYPDEATPMEESDPTKSPPRDNPAKGTKLKDLFAPRDEEAGFSLLGHLDLDLELDEEAPFAIEEPTSASHEAHLPQFQPTVAPAFGSAPTNAHSTTYINPKQALFFPLPPSSGGFNATKAKQRDVFDVIRDNKWNWRDPAVGFYRTSTEEQIRQDWEEKKGELTKDWKKRAREAGKMNRRRKGGVDAEGEF